MPIESGQAVLMREYGPPEVLKLESLPLPPLEPTEVRIRTTAAAINHSDLEIRAGNWPILRDEPFPYVPGLEATGEVVETGSAVESVQVGERVTTMMQGLGGVRAHRPGGYQEYVTVDADAVAKVPDDLDPLAVAALGLAAMTAHQGLAKLGALAGRRVVVTGAAGGVGSVAVAIAAAQGAEVVGIVRDSDGFEYVRSLGAAEAVSDAGTLARRSVDGVLDTVAGALFEPLVGALKPEACLSVVGGVGGDRVNFSVWELMRGISITGYSSEALDGNALRLATADVFSLMREGRLEPPASQSFSLADAADAHRLLERGGVRGRVLLVPAA